MIKYIGNVSKFESPQVNKARVEANVVATKPWSRGLFMCCDDCGLCCITTLFPCATFGVNASKMSAGESYLIPLSQYFS